MAAEMVSLPQPEISPGKEWGLDSRLAKVKAGLEITGRKFGITGKELFTVGSLAGLGLAVGAVLGIGMHEASLVSKNPQDLGFAWKYATENFWTSFIWINKPTELIALAMGSQPTEALKDFAGTVADAQVQLQIYGHLAARGIATMVLTLGQIVRLTNIGAEANRIFKNRVLAGREKMLRWASPEEVVVRFAGRQSDVTDFSAYHDGAHLLPVFEEPELVSDFVAKHTRDGKQPKVWQIPSGRYGKAESWDGFHYPPKWLIKRDDGSRVLVVEADASVGEQALALSKESAADLDIQEVAQGFRKVRDMVKRDGAKPADSFRVLLADSQQEIVTGGGGTRTLREQISEQHEANILIDAKAPLILEILGWAEVATGDEKQIVFDTTNQEYFATVKALLETNGYQVFDVAKDKGKYSNQTPRVVYQSTTADTAQTIAD